MRAITSIIKVTSSCNLACSYCYATNRTGRFTLNSVMSNQVLERITEQLFKLDSDIVEFNWHGGEPLLAGINFFQRALELQERYRRKGQRIINSLQTNGTLINSKWADFFARNNFSIGVSLDGPAEIHDKYRRYGSNKSSFNQVLRGIKYLQQYKIFFGILMVVTKDSMTYTKDIFDLCTKNDLTSFDFLPMVGLDKSGDGLSISNDSLSPGEFGEFLIKMYNYWIEKDNPNIKIRFFENAMLGILGGQPSLCNFSGRCSGYFTITTDGDVYHCDWFIGDENKRFGNIMQDELSDISLSSRYLQYIASINQPKSECLDCKWKLTCNGGCVHYRDIQGDFQKPFYFCESRKMIFEYMRHHIDLVETERMLT